MQNNDYRRSMNNGKVCDIQRKTNIRVVTLFCVQAMQNCSLCVCVCTNARVSACTKISHLFLCISNAELPCLFYVCGLCLC